VVASASLSNEALYLVRRILVDHLGLEVVVPVDRGEPRKIKNSRREWVQSVDAHANSAGARLLGLSTVDAGELAAFVREGAGALLVLDERAHPWLASDEAASAVAERTVVVAARGETSLTRAASIVLPLASWVETEGTYTSSTGRVQLVRRAFPPAAQAQPAWWILHEVGLALGVASLPEPRPARLLERLADEVAAFEGVTTRGLAHGPGLAVATEVSDVD
jgi:NADH dehydrogenase/NADH:ubiquinone oxidoreductase subunit G